MTALHLRRLSPLVAVLALLATLLPSPAHADAGAESQFVSELNAARQSAGLAPLPTSGDLVAVARRHSERMASQSHLHHNPNLGSEVSGWQKVGENVGRGPSVGAIHSALMDSPGHRANILGGDWTEVGVGVVVRDGTIWVTQVFRLPSSAPASSDDGSSSGSSGGSSSSGSSSGGSSSGGSSSGEASSDAPAGAAQDPEPEAADAPSPQPEAAEPEPEPEPEPRVTPPGPRHEVSEPPLPLDRMQLTLARLDAREAAPAAE